MGGKLPWKISHGSWPVSITLNQYINIKNINLNINLCPMYKDMHSLNTLLKTTVLYTLTGVLTRMYSHLSHSVPEYPPDPPCAVIKGEWFL